MDFYCRLKNMIYPERVNSKIKPLIISLHLLVGVMVSLLACSRNSAPRIEGMVYIPAEEFIIGSNDMDVNALAKEFGAKQSVYFENEKPMRTIYLGSFYIDKFETTNEEYKLFISKTGRKPPIKWVNGTYPTGKAKHPVVNVTWYDADIYCKWMGKRLPEEEEWEKTARGPKGNKYPWGNEFDIKKGNFTTGDTLPVGNMIEDKSFYGVYDMGGNVMEWTSSWYNPYPNSTLQSKDFGENNRVIKGGYGSVVGHYNLGSFYSRGPFRNYFPPTGKGVDVGFRCANDK